ncbi:TPA: hypothetical protein AB5D93_003248, partial [Vibrio cholerae]
RPDFDLESLSAQILKQQSNGYKVAYVKSGDAVLGVAGFCICEKLAWGKHIYEQSTLATVSINPYCPMVLACAMAMPSSYQVNYLKTVVK